MNNTPVDFSWDIFRKNIKTLRKHYHLRQEDVAENTGCSRGAYQHCETKGAGGLLMELCTFWYNNYSITPTDLLIKELKKEDIEKIEKRIKFEQMNKKVKVAVKKSR